MNRQEFNEAAVAEFGDKVTVAPIKVTLEELDKFLERSRVPVTIEDFESYPEQVWVPSGLCPRCGAMLSGLLGWFRWGIIHGEGHCANCNTTAFRYYHYVKEGAMPIQAFALIGF